MLTRHQIHHRHVVGGRHEPHPVGVRGVGAVKVIEVTVFEYLHGASERELVTLGGMWRLIKAYK